MPDPYPKAKEVEVFAPKTAGDKTGGAGYEDDKAPDLSVLTGWRAYASETAKRKHWEWFVIDQFLRGNHNVRGNPSDNTIVVTQRTDSINFPINKVFSTFRAVRSFVTRHRPFVEVEPDDSSEGAMAYARRANKLLERDNKLNNFRKGNKEWVYYGVKYGIGWRQMGYDKVKKVTTRWTVDPFDLLVGSKTGKAEDAPYLVKDIIRTLGYLKNKYPETSGHLAPDNKIAGDEYKELGMQILFPDTYSAVNTQNEQTVTAHECWYRVFKPNKNGGLINKCLFTKTGILEFVETPYTEHPFIAYESDIMPNETYPEGHIKHIISPQRMLNILETQLLEYNHIVNRGRFLKDKNAGFRVIYAKEGQIIEKNAGKNVQVLNPPGINPALPEQIRHANDYIEDIGGQHDASQGVRPTGVTAGKAIEALQQGDSNSISDLRDNFEDSLAKEAAWILKIYSLFEHEGIVLDEEIKNEQGKSEKQKFAAVGAGAMQKMNVQLPTNPDTGKEAYYMEDNGAYCDVCTILPDNQVKVSVTSEFGETKQAKQDLLFQLVEHGLPLKFVLKYMEFPDIDDIFQRIADETVADMQVEALKAQANQPPEAVPPEGNVPPPPPPEDLNAINQELGGLVGG